MEQILLHSSQAEPALLTPSSWSSSLQNFEPICFCCLSRQVCDALLWQPEQTNTQGSILISSITSLPWTFRVFLQSLLLKILQWKIFPHTISHQHGAFLEENWCSKGHVCGDPFCQDNSLEVEKVYIPTGRARRGLSLCSYNHSLLSNFWIFTILIREKNNISVLFWVCIFYYESFEYFSVNVFFFWVVGLAYQFWRSSLCIRDI